MIGSIYDINKTRYALWLCVLFILSANHTFAEEPVAPKASDVRLVIDISGSMKKNDPLNLRRPALDMLVQLLPKGSKAGIWTFGQYVNAIVAHQKVSDSWGKKAIAASSQIRSIAQFTNIGEALEKAAFDANQTNSDFKRHVILLTDGMVDIDRDGRRNQQERQRILQQILPMYDAADITLHTIALSDNADLSLLNRLALQTDGKAAVAKDADELMNVFLQVFDQAVPAEEAIFDGESFLVDSSIEEFTALIFRQPNAKDTQIIAPDGQAYSQASSDPRVKWHHTNQYDMITIGQPLEGEWKVVADLEPQSRVTVVSDLSIVVDTMPTNIALDEVVETTLALREENKTITRLEFLGLLDIDAKVVGDNGKSWTTRMSKNRVPEDGLFPVVLDQFDQEGQYTIDFVVDGKSFKRQYSHQIIVRTPFAVEVETQKKNGKQQFIVQVSPQSKTINMQQTTIVGVLTDPKGNSEQLPFIITNDGAWMLLVSPEKPGDYSLSITVKGNNGQADTPLETIRLSQNGAAQKMAPPVVEKEPVVEAKAEEIAETPVEEEVADQSDEGMDIQSMILYGVIGLVNILILIVGYILYRKFLRKKPEDDSGETSGDIAGSDEEVEGFVEPPMDDMAVEDIEDEDDEAQPEEETPAEEGGELDTDESASEEGEEAGDAEQEDQDVGEEDTEEADDEDDMGELDLDDDEDVPDFSLDDFSPESLDEDDLSGDEGEDEEEKD